ncbi:GAF domain-containing protein [Herpetosiphon geysericola]|uniref:histidine kinase n=1 Tax=Herpetosiphon geysericola TaxID=70996 RepID=A0A0P6Y228_9CHLR|nr:GAF domain-containing protein [Herpetosiphon geysericola]KPL85895.1 hypothetical protein SE18_13325 [Herpetosiphon geysericola]
MNELPLQILVVDDEPRLSGQLRLLLEGQGYSVTTAVGGAAGIATLQASDVDVVLTDVTMPDVDGYTVLQWVRENRPDMPIIVMTGYGSLESATRALRLGAYDYILKPFSLPTVQAALNRASAAVAKRRADGQRTAELSAIAAIARQMGRSLEPVAMADATLSAIAESTGAQVALLYTAAENGMRWHLWRHVGLNEQLIQQLAELFPPSPLSKATIVWEDRPPWLAEMPYELLQGICSSVGGKVAWGALPLDAGPQALMSLVLVGSSRKTQAWSPPFLISLGNALSMALVNTRLFNAVREERDRLRLLYGISRELASSLDPDQLLSRIIQHTVAAVNAERGSIIISSQDGRTTQRIVARYGMDQSVTESVAAALLQAGLSGWVFRQREAARIADVRVDKRWVELPSTRGRVRSALAVPLLREDQVLGVMTLTHPRIDHFSAADLELVRSVSAQAAVAIENANLFAELEQRVFDLEGLNSTSRELASSLDPLEVARKVAYRCAEMLAAPMVALLHVDDKGGTLPLVSLINGQEQPLLKLGPISAALNDQEPVLLTSAGSQIELLVNNEEPLGESWIGVPLMLGDGINGLLIAADERRDAFDAYERQLLTALAGQAAVAMESARLYVTASEERTLLAAVIESVSDGILLTDEGQIVVANPAAGAIAGVSNSRLVNQPLLTFFPMLAILARREDHESKEIAINNRYYAVNTAPLQNSSLGGQVIVLQDITHFKELDQIKSRFVSMVSHDLKSPLTAIQGYAQLVADGHMGTVNEMQRDALQAVVRNTGAMTALISDLLDLGKIEAGIGISPQETDLSVVLREVIDELKLRAKQGQISVQPEIPPSLPLLADPSRMRQVFTNILSNAIKYTPAGGKVVVKASNGDTKVHVQIQDSGLGIPEDSLPHIFERFYRVKRDIDSPVEGTGLGLAITKSIVDEHGGTIEVQSAIGQGTTFNVYLPQHK